MHYGLASIAKTRRALLSYVAMSGAQEPQATGQASELLCYPTQGWKISIDPSDKKPRARFKFDGSQRVAVTEVPPEAEGTDPDEEMEEVKLHNLLTLVEISVEHEQSEPQRPVSLPIKLVGVNNRIGHLPDHLTYTIGEWAVEYSGNKAEIDIPIGPDGRYRAYIAPWDITPTDCLHLKVKGKVLKVDLPVLATVSSVNTGYHIALRMMKDGRVEAKANEKPVFLNYESKIDEVNYECHADSANT